MTTQGIEAVFLETHNWGRTARFFQALGFTLEFETDHNSGHLRNGDGPYVFIAEVPPGKEPGIQIVLEVADADGFRLRSTPPVTAGLRRQQRRDLVDNLAKCGALGGTRPR